MNAEQLKTKDKILKVAGELFAVHGFSGTSVRDIAKVAEVNLSAVNYHFTNKEGLYFQVFLHNHAWMEESIHKMAKSENSISELGLKVFDFFIAEGNRLNQVFRFFLNDMSFPEELSCSIKGEGDFGPPGQNALLELINKEVDVSIPNETKYWAMLMIFSMIVHTAVKMNTPFMKKKAEQLEVANLNNQRIAIKHHTNAIMAYLKTNPVIWSN